MKRLILIIAMVLLGAPTVFAQNGHDLFQKALQKERAEGNLEAAIALYARIVEEHASDRALVAKALVQMGQDYERLGRTEEAQRVFATVAREYADQAEAARLARAKVATAPREPGEEESGIVIRRIDFGTDTPDSGGAPTPDGRHLVMVNWNTGDLVLRNLTTGAMRPLTHKGSWEASWEFALLPIPSTDGKQIAFAWYNEKELFDLRIVGLDGSEPRVVYRNDEEVVYLQPDGWSPDGKHILALLSKIDNTNQIAMISAADGTPRVLKTLDWRHPQNMSLSPDGRYVVYDLPPEQDRPERDLYLLATDGSRETRIVDHPANDLMPVWTPDGNHILFFSDRTGTLDAWLLPVADGEKQGAPELVKTNIGATWPMGFTREGAFYYARQIGMSNIYVGTLDPATGNLAQPPTQISNSFVGTNSEPTWSPDGRHLAYLSRRNLLGSFPGSSVLVIHTVDTGEERELQPELSNMYGSISWSPDGRSILIRGGDRKNHWGIYGIDTRTGEATLTVQNEPENGNSLPLWSADGKAIFFKRFESSDTLEANRAIIKRDFETGREQVLFRGAEGTNFQKLTLSPDGQHLAFSMVELDALYPSRLMILPVTGGEPQEVARLQEYIRGLTWTPDGRQLLFSKKVDGSVWRIPVEGGTPQKMDLRMEMILDLHIHPDGQHIAFSAGFGRVEVWVMEGFLPADDGTK